MTFLSNIWVAARFELVRSLAPRRIANIAVLSAFPPAMLGILVYGPGMIQVEFVLGATVMMVCFLALLLWVSPIVSTELEGRTWSYQALRPGGKIALVLGKYVAAVVYAICVGGLALTAGVVVSSVANPQGNELRIWLVYGVLIVLACITYGAVLVLIGVVMHRRAMVAAVFYMVGFEVFLADIPAVINQLTVSFHLQGLALRWLGLDLFEDESILGEMFAAQPTWQHLVILCVIASATLLASVYWLKTREFITVDEA